MQKVTVRGKNSETAWHENARQAAFHSPLGGVESYFFAKYAPVVFVGQLLNSAPDRAVFAFITPTLGLY